MYEQVQWVKEKLGTDDEERRGSDNSRVLTRVFESKARY